VGVRKRDASQERVLVAEGAGGMAWHRTGQQPAGDGRKRKLDLEAAAAARRRPIPKTHFVLISSPVHLSPTTIWLDPKGIRPRKMRVTFKGQLSSVERRRIKTCTRVRSREFAPFAFARPVDGAALESTDRPSFALFVPINNSQRCPRSLSS
jgi:hypothetical protein